MNREYPADMAIAGKNGWDESEREMLFIEAERGRREGLPLKAVFEKVAGATGRKPNSIRNYYYNSMKGEDGEKKNSVFTPFTRDEIFELMVEVLSAQAKGQSVRAIALALGNGDKKSMLRYQNKYRSIVRSNAAFVKQVMDYMRDKGIPCFDPYSRDAIDGRRGRSGRKPGRAKAEADMIEIVGGIMEDMRKLDGTEIAMFFKGLKRLTGMALGEAVENGEGYRAKLTLAEDREQLLLLKQRESERTVEELLEKLKMQDEQLMEQRSALINLMSMFRQLIKVNSDFLNLNSVVKVSNLSDYINKLQRSIEKCQSEMKYAPA